METYIVWRVQPGHVYRNVLITAWANRCFQASGSFLVGMLSQVIGNKGEWLLLREKGREGWAEHSCKLRREREGALWLSWKPEVFVHTLFSGQPRDVVQAAFSVAKLMGSRRWARESHWGWEDRCRDPGPTSAHCGSCGKCEARRRREIPDHSASSKGSALGYTGAIARAFWEVEGGGGDGTEYSVHFLVPTFHFVNQGWEVEHC